MSKNQKDWLAYTGLGIQMVVTMMICLWIGMKLEDKFYIVNPYGQLIGIFFGLFASIYNLIKSVKLFDVYEGENIPSDKKSIALNVTIQSSEKTLNESDLERINSLIISTVENKSGAKIRS